jgi:hypothetical protein
MLCNAPFHIVSAASQLIADSGKLDTQLFRPVRVIPGAD